MTAYTTVIVPGRLTGANITTFINPSLVGDTFAPGTDVFLRVKTAGTATTVTVMNAGANSGPSGTFLTPLNLQPLMAATDDRIYGPFPAATFADPSDGQVHVAYSATASVTVQVLNMSAS